jgi:rhodanese-related sulfurtransferase
MNEYISPQALSQRLNSETPPLVIDVRSTEEYQSGHIPDALHLPGDTLADHVATLPKEREIVTY